MPETAEPQNWYETELKVERDALYEVFSWLLGEKGDFPMRPDGAGLYWWRKDLRKRLAAIKPYGTSDDKAVKGEVSSTLLRDAALDAKAVLFGLEHIGDKPICPRCGCKRHYGHAKGCDLRVALDKLEAATSVPQKKCE